MTLQSEQTVTFTQFSNALSVVRSILIDNGWSAAEAKTGTEDGNWLLQTINTIDKDGCPNCFLPTIRNLVKRLEEQSQRLVPKTGWTTEHSMRVMECLR